MTKQMRDETLRSIRNYELGIRNCGSLRRAPKNLFDFSGNPNATLTLRESGVWRVESGAKGHFVPNELLLYPNYRSGNGLRSE